MPGAIIFDLDGVLIDSEGLQYKAYSQVLAAFGVTVSIDEYAAHWIAAGRGPEYAVETYALPVSADEVRARKHPIYHAILREAVTVMPGAVAALSRLQSRWPLAVATNSNRADVAFVLDHFAVRGCFAAVVAREDYAQAKPLPDAYLTAAARLHVSPRACLVVEDSHRGVLAGHRAGAVVVAVPNRFTRGTDLSLAARVLRSLDDLTVDMAEQLLQERTAQ